MSTYKVRWLPFQVNRNENPSPKHSRSKVQREGEAEHVDQWKSEPRDDRRKVEVQSHDDRRKVKIDGYDRRKVKIDGYDRRKVKVVSGEKRGKGEIINLR